MPSAKTVIGAEAATLAVRVARGLYARWRVLPARHRERLAPLAADAKEKALSLRGAPDRRRAEADLRAASETLAAALVDSAEDDREVDEAEVDRLREDLRRELRRLEGAEISAARVRPERPASPE